MNAKIGTLKIIPVRERLDLVAEPVRLMLAERPDLVEQTGVVEIDQSLADTAAFCARYDVGLDVSVNCVVVKATRAERSWYAACMIQATTRADVNGLVRRHLDARKVSFAPVDEAVALTGMEYGGITPIGLPADWSILIDAAIVSLPHIVIGSGARRSKLVLPGAMLSALPGAVILDGLGMMKVEARGAADITSPGKGPDL